MAVRRLDPRVNVDRIYQYTEYQVLSDTFKHRGRSRGPSWLSRKILHRPYIAGLIAGLLLLTLCLLLIAYLGAETTRLAYAEQGYTESLGGLDQSRAEALAANLRAESNVLAGGVLPAVDVVYPGSMTYLVMTNIPRADGCRLVRELYPLSRRIIRVEP